jgi:hypothetical protein
MGRLTNGQIRYAGVENDPALSIPELDIEGRLDERRQLRLSAAHAELYIAAESFTREKCRARAVREISAVAGCFPTIDDDAAILAMASSFGVLCIVDDSTEKMGFEDAQQALMKSIDVVSRAISTDVPLSTTEYGGQRTDSNGSDPELDRVPRLMIAFVNHVRDLVPASVYNHFLLAISDLWQSMLTELGHRKDGAINEVEYLALRMRTIGLAPLFVLVQHHFNVLQVPEDEKSTLDKMIAHVKMAVGLQNDVVGLERDLAQCEAFNFVLLLGREHTVDHIRQRRIKAATLHNRAVELSLYCWHELKSESRSMQACGDALLVFVHRHFMWAMTSHRYDPRPANERMVRLRLAFLLASLRCIGVARMQWAKARRMHRRNRRDDHGGPDDPIVQGRNLRMRTYTLPSEIRCSKGAGSERSDGSGTKTEVATTSSPLQEVERG